MPSKENNNWSRNEDVHASNPGEREIITSPLIHRQYMVSTRMKTGRVMSTILTLSFPLGCANCLSKARSCLTKGISQLHDRTVPTKRNRVPY